MDKIIKPAKAYRNREFLNSPSARTVRILSEYLEPDNRFRKLNINHTVLFFGSARIDPNKPGSRLEKYYWEAEELAYLLSKWSQQINSSTGNFVICTGGGGGFMEAANRGASRAGGKSIGMNISLPHEQNPNPYISPELAFEFHYFFMRKFWLINKAKAIVALPGGFGTLDEVFETLTLVQTTKIQPDEISILLYGEEYWRKIVDFDALVEYQTISPKDLDLFFFSSDPHKAFEELKKRLAKHL